MTKVLFYETRFEPDLGAFKEEHLNSDHQSDRKSIAFIMNIVKWMEFSQAQNKTVNEYVFSNYLIDLAKFIASRRNEKFRSRVIILDNVSYYKTKEVMKILN